MSDLQNDFRQASEQINAQALMLILIEARMNEAARVLRFMPSSDRRFLGGIKAHWPDHMQEDFDKWIGYEKKGRTKLPPLSATPAQISRMDECLYDWLPWLLPAELRDKAAPPDVPHIVWARSNRLSWKEISTIRHSMGQMNGGNSHVSLRKIYRRGIASIADRLARESRQLTIPDDWSINS